MATTTTLTLAHGNDNWMGLVASAFAGTADHLGSTEVVFTGANGVKLHVFGTGFTNADLAGGEINGFTLYIDDAAETAGDPFATATGYNLQVDTTPGLAVAIAAHDGAAVFEFLLSQAIDPGIGSSDDDWFAATGFGDVIDGSKSFDTVDYSGVDAKFSDGQHEGIRVTLGTSGHVEVAHLDGFGNPGLYSDDLVGIEKIIGTENADTFKANPAYANGTNGTIEFVGGAGADVFLVAGGHMVVGYDDEELLIHPLGGTGVTVDLSGGASVDTYGDADIFDFSAGTTFLIRGTSLNDEFVGGAISGRFEGGTGDDTFTLAPNPADAEIVFVGDGGADSFIGDLTHPDHAVRVDYGLENAGSPSSAVTVNLSAAAISGADAMTAIDSLGGVDVFQDIGSFVVKGTHLADTFIGGDGDGVFLGGDGADYFTTEGTGHVTYVGGAGGDTMSGSAGHPEQRIVIDYGAETGGLGVSVYLLGGYAFDSFGDGDGFVDIGTFRIVGTDKGDSIAGNDFGGEIWSGAGNDELFGASGNDTFRPGTSVVSDYVNGGGGFDRIEAIDKDAVNAYVHVSAAGSGALAVYDGSSSSIGVATFYNLEGAVGSLGNDTFGAEAGAAAADASDFGWTGGDGADFFDNQNGGAILVDYDLEKLYQAGFDGEWGDDPGELGVKVNLSNAQTFNSFPDYGVLIDFDGTGAVNQFISLAAAIDTFGKLDAFAGTMHVRGTDALDILAAAETDSFFDARGGSDYLFGRGGNDTFIGGSGDDHVDGAGGNGDTVDYSHEGGGSAVTVDLAAASAVDSFGDHDTLIHIENVIGTAGRDFLFGDGFGNRLEGGAQDDDLDGRGGADLMIGGLGADTYSVADIDDVVDETGGDGVDLIRSSISLSLSDTLHVVGAVEQLALTGSADAYATGNALANFLAGNGGANHIDGLAGADLMIGGDGNDVYGVDQLGDVVDETGTGGKDTVESSISFRLTNAAHAKGAIENLTLLGAGAKSGYGNGLANVIVGANGRNTLDGGRGNDVLTGKAGADKFLFDSKLNAKINRDHVTDFKHGADRIALDDDIFRKVGHKITADSFHLGTAAGDATDRIIYDRAHGRLYYDSDGTGGHAKVLFAILDNHAALTAGDFVVVA